MDYLPYITDINNELWDIVEIHVCVDFGGRQLEVVTQKRETLQNRSFTIYGLDMENEFISENCKFYKWAMKLFMDFDTTGKVATYKDV